MINERKCLQEDFRKTTCKGDCYKRCIRKLCSYFPTIYLYQHHFTQHVISYYNDAIADNCIKFCFFTIFSPYWCLLKLLDYLLQWQHRRRSGVTVYTALLSCWCNEIMGRVMIHHCAHVCPLANCQIIICVMFLLSLFLQIRAAIF